MADECRDFFRSMGFDFEEPESDPEPSPAPPAPRASGRSLADFLLRAQDRAQWDRLRADYADVFNIAEEMRLSALKRRPPPPPLALDDVTAAQVTVFDNHMVLPGKAPPKRKPKYRFALSLKAWKTAPATINFAAHDQTWSLSGDILNAKELKEKAVGLQKTKGHGKVLNPISDEYRDWLIARAEEMPESHFAVLMHSSPVHGTLVNDYELAVIDWEPITQAAASCAIIKGPNAGLITVPPFVNHVAGKPTVHLAERAILQSRRCNNLPNWNTGYAV